MAFYAAPESQKVEDVRAWHFRKMSHHSLWIPVGFIILVLKRRRLYMKADHLSVNMRNHSAFAQHGWGILVFWMLFSLWRADLEAGGSVWMFALKSTFTLEAHILCFRGLCWHKMWKSGFETNPRRSTLKKNRMWLITVWWSMALGQIFILCSSDMPEHTYKCFQHQCLCKWFKIGTVWSNVQAEWCAPGKAWLEEPVQKQPTVCYPALKQASAKAAWFVHRGRQQSGQKEPN